MHSRLLAGKLEHPVGGPEIGRILTAVYERQLDGEVTSLEGARDAARRLLRN